MNGQTEPLISYTLGDMHAAQPCCVPKAHLAVRNLSFAYDNQIVLDTVSLGIYKGCITALIGPSGCGKTSFLSVLNRLTDMLPTVRVCGSVVFDGQELLEDTVDLLGLRRRIGMIFQRPNPFPLSIRRNLELPLSENGVRGRALRARKIETALRDLGLWEEVKDRLDSSALALSGGQQQRLCIARALVLEPEVLLMDEPCSAPDPVSSAVVEELASASARALYRCYRHLQSCPGKTQRKLRRIFWMKEKMGKLIEVGKAQSLFETPAYELTAAYIAGAKG